MGKSFIDGFFGEVTIINSKNELRYVKAKCPHAKELEAAGMAVFERGTGSDALKFANG
jgi:hypothetical protein